MPHTANKTPPSENLEKYISNIPDFPKKGVLFRDISPLLRQHFGTAISQMADMLSHEEWQNIDVIGGVESRGFILAAALAAVKQKGFVKIRKRGKLPGPVLAKKYGLEYGEDALEMHYGEGRMLIVDDVLATGGTLAAAADLADECGYEVIDFLCLINLLYLNQFSWRGLTPKTLIQYSE